MTKLATTRESCKIKKKQFEIVDETCDASQRITVIIIYRDLLCEATVKEYQIRIRKLYVNKDKA